MKYLKIFENIKISECEIKSIIDWTYYNFLLDKLTRYEDDGYTIEIKISINNIEVYAYYTADELEFIYQDGNYINLNILAPYRVSFKILANLNGFVSMYFPTIFWQDIENYNKFTRTNSGNIALYLNIKDLK